MTTGSAARVPAESGPQPAGRPPTLPSDQVALGEGLQRRAVEVASRVRGRWECLRSDESASISAETAAAISRTCELATLTVGHVLATGAMPTVEQWKELAVVGKAAASDAISLEEMTKLYFYWRDISIEVLREEATLLGTMSQRLAEAEALVCAGSDASLVRMAKQFDERRQQLQERLRADQARLVDLARHDPLTGLPNRVVLYERLREAVEFSRRRGPRAVVLFVDLDGFKAVNDRQGHAAGDGVLVAVAERLEQLTRATDMVARLGGDEFVILCTELQEVGSEADRVVARVEAALQEPFLVAGQPLVLSASIGRAVVGPSDDPERLLCRADADMYVAKHGRSTERG
jgi:diguanylate cyclase (GGDEF)-like protein